MDKQFIKNNKIKLDKEANKGRSRKIELAYRLTQNMYNKKVISYKTKILQHSC